MALASSARADGSNHEKAVSLFEEAGKFLETGDCDNAIPKLRDSLELEASGGARMALAACYESRDPIAAWRLLKDAASLAAANHDDDRMTSAESRATALEKRLPTFRVVLPPGLANDAAFELRVDGRAVDPYYLRTGVFAALPGLHHLEASAPMRKWSATVAADVAAPGQALVLLERDVCAITPAETTAHEVAARDRGEPVGSARRTLGLTIAGVGLAGIATGAVFGVIALNKKSSLQSACGGNTGNCVAPSGSLDSDQEAMKTTSTISTVSFVAGGVALLGGGLLYFTAPRAEKTGRIKVLPSVGQNSASLHVLGEF